MNSNAQRAMLVSLVILLSIAVTYVIYTSFFLYLFQTWKIDPFYLHGPGIGLISFILYVRFVWQRRKSPILSLLHLQYAVAALSLGVLFFIFGVRSRLPFLGGLSFFFWGLAVQFLFFGPACWKESSFPFAYFLLAVPLPYLSELSGLAQTMVARLAHWKMSALGYVIMREGVNLHLPNASFQISPDCTGIKSWLVLLSLVVFFLYFFKMRLWAKMLIAVLVLPVSFVSNFLRVLLLLFLGHYKGQEAAMWYWHDFSGLTFYSLACVLILAAGALVARYGRIQ